MRLQRPIFAAAAASKGRVVVNGIGSNSIQGDLEFVEILQQMGAQTLIRPNSVEVTDQRAWMELMSR